MFGVIKRFFRRDDVSLSRPPREGITCVQNNFRRGLVETDWIESRSAMVSEDLDFSSVSSFANKFATRIVRDVSEERLVLPTIPELGLAVRRKVQDPSSSAADLTRLLQIDLTISSKLIQVANSPAYAGYEPVDTLNHAVTRSPGWGPMLSGTLLQGLHSSNFLSQNSPVYEGASGISGSIVSAWRRTAQSWHDTKPILILKKLCWRILSMM